MLPCMATTGFTSTCPWLDVSAGDLRVSTTDVIDAPLGIVLVSFAVDVIVQCADHLHATQFACDACRQHCDT